MSDSKTITCLLAAVAVVGGIVFARCTADRQWDPNRVIPTASSTAKR